MDFLNEMPVNGRDLYNLSARKKYLSEVLKLLNQLKVTEEIKKFNQEFNYFLTFDFFVLLKDSEIQAFIRYHKKGKAFYIDVIENITRTPEVSLKMYSFILNNLKFKEIITGDVLSDKNISAHKKFLTSSPAFSVYIKDKTGARVIKTEEEIDTEMKNSGNRDSVFVLRENLSLISRMYNSTEEEVLEEYLDNFSNYIKKLKE